MKLDFDYRNNVFILGAGASKDYGLPIWKELDSLIKERLKGTGSNQYSRAKDILIWLYKIGERNEYKTIDECIEKESVSGIYHSDGDTVENELFRSIKDIFNEVYVENNEGWITRLSDKILRQPGRFEEKIAFISYNYDDILEKNLLRFEYLPGKHSRLNYKSRLDQLSKARVPVLYAHGNFYSKPEVSQNSHTERHFRTIKSDVSGYIDAVSCYESYNHEIDHSVYANALNLYILGLGGGLRFNLSKLSINQPVSQIFVTISNASDDEEVIKFLNTKFKVSAENISIYRDCTNLIEKCF